MSHLIFSFNAVFPLLIMMSTGVLARRVGWIKDGRAINTCVFHIFLPLMLFFNIVDTKVDHVLDMKTFLYSIISSTIIFLILFLIVPRFIKKRESIGVMIQGIGRSNYAIFGIPLVINLYPNGEATIAALVAVVLVPIYNIFSTIALMMYGSKKTSVKKVLIGVLKNPLIISTVSAFIFWRVGIKIPTLIAEPLREMGGVATTLALFALGASLDFSSIKTNSKYLTIALIGRLVIVPLLGLGFAIMIGIRDVSLATLIAVFASPVAVSSYPMAQQMGGDDALAGAHVVLSTAFSSLTVLVWIAILSAMGCLT